MKRVLRYHLLLIAVLLIGACNCRKDYKGIVLDQESHLPVAGVTISTAVNPVKDTSVLLTVTDTSGRFSFSFGERGIFGCSNKSFYFDKEGYIAFLTGKPENMDTVWIGKDEAASPY